MRTTHRTSVIRLTGAALAAGLVAGVTSPASAAGDPSPLRYVALGDSVASGIGAGRTTDSVDGCWADEARTRRIANHAAAYPNRIASALKADLDFTAYCGASVAHVRKYQLDTLSAATDLVTVQVGANDFGYARVLEQCVKGAADNIGICNMNIARINMQYRLELPGKLRKLYDKIKLRAKNAKVVVVGYPRIVSPDSTPLCLSDGIMPRSTHQQMTRAAATLNATLKREAEHQDFEFVDPTNSFKGHEVCGDPEWVNGIKPLAFVDSFHPNTAGHEALGWLVWQKVKPTA
ncbi:SGNH/GDSL hydrolase family protein [Streptomyces solicathayae]|uniref:SGNH/GDSL hydrolase family protein n=1 Tax=Streptomyces solicathayae TaxID=3081768 RepID=A0ABZ0M5L9_9ACTN|nr:SGNH/GDSL hydrolase family protein [Streptomyces sp. HUAS YS2]WOX26354.1 SGNH/GDSL hydrolase family protein [Streptomyces sp. HUAS YS2]